MGTKRLFKPLGEDQVMKFSRDSLVTPASAVLLPLVLVLSGCVADTAFFEATESSGLEDALVDTDC
jgi:hypothetical protein